MVAEYPGSRNLTLRQQALSRSTDLSESSTRRKESTMKALKMSIIHVVAFVVSWTPYTVMATW